MKKQSGKHALKNESKINLFVIIILIIILCIGIIVLITSINKKKQIEETINTAFLGLKENDIGTANKYLDYETLVNSLDKIIIEQDEINNLDTQKKLFDKMEWNIEKIKMLNNNKAEATIKVTNIDYNNIIIKWIQTILEIDESTISDKVKVEKLKDILSETTETKEITEKINLVKNEGNWTIEVDNNLRDLIFTGIDSIVAVQEEYK